MAEMSRKLNIIRDDMANKYDYWEYINDSFSINIYQRR